MRAIGCFLLGIVAAVLVVAFGIFALENGQMTQFTFLGNTMRINLWLLVGIPAVVGFLVALLAVTPARAAGDRHGTVLRGQFRSLERDLADQRRQNEELRTENSRWQARYQQVVAERDTLNTRLETVQQAVAQPAHVTPAATTPVTATPETPVTATPETPVAATPAQRDTMVYDEPSTATRREEPVAPMGPTGMGYDRAGEQPVTTDETAMRGERPVTDEAATQREPVQGTPVTETTPPAQPTLGERLRGMFGGERTTQEEEADRINSRGPAPTM